MTGNSERFPWPSYYGHFNFFEECMAQHDRVALWRSEDGGTYELTLKNGKALRVFVCECYAFGVAEYEETVSNLGPLDAIIISSAWCGYSHDAKRYCRGKRVGLFKIGEFMAALNRADFWNYLTASEKEYFRKRGW